MEDERNERNKLSEMERSTLFQEVRFHNLYKSRMVPELLSLKPLVVQKYSEFVLPNKHHCSGNFINYYKSSKNKL